MSVRFICRKCHNAYKAGQMFGSLCPRCVRDMAVKARLDDDKTALADDLVRGSARNSQETDS